MKKRTKGDFCLNCSEKLGAEINYCSKCGQENNTNQLSFGQVVKDFLSNYISLDSRFVRSFIPFLLKPGFLTKAFMEGKRASYANPIRWYLVISLVHFFILSQVTKTFTDEGDRIFNIEQSNDSSVAFDIENDSIVEDDEEPDSITKDSVEIAKEGNDIITEKQLELIEALSKTGASKKEIFDTLQVDTLSFGSRIIVKQTVKLALDDQLSLNSYVIQNVPILIFILLPLYALLLKLFFRKKLYINHLIHSIYIHSLLFFGLIFYWMLFLILDNSIPPILNFLFFGLLSIHHVMSFKELYDVKLFKAIWSFLLSGFIYSILLSFGFLILVLVSLLLF